MKVLTASQMHLIDRLTTERYGIPSLTLMESAGRGVVEFLNQRFVPLSSQKISIICGRGNNGGDGLVVARLLREQGLAPRVVLLADPTSLKGDVAANYERLSASGAPQVALDADAWHAQKKDLEGTTLLIDAILGTGLSRPVEGFLREVIRDLNDSFSGARVVAVDLPSGINADSGDLIGDFVRADATVTFTAPKVAHVFPPACEQMGEWVVKPIGTPAQALTEDPELFLNLTCPEDLGWLSEPRHREAHKGDYGRVLIVAGSVGKTGAAAMAAKAALRAGAGLVTVATAKSALPIVASLGMEFMTEPLPETDAGTVSLRALDYGRMEKLLEDKTVLALGPGLGAVPETAEFIRTVVNESKIPTVLDADGLNAFAGRMKTFGAGRASPPDVVFTPHPGEMGRLLEVTASEVQRSRVEVARKFAVHYKATLVLKGYRTLVAAPSGQVAVNPTGNPGMATGGTGDVLTGMIAGFLAQYPARPIAEVVAGAVYLHGLAGDFAARDFGETSMIAGDLLQALPKARRAVEGGDRI
jgi:hydroxyethylthiazole kinase-like uncharacterized protein yjeF